MSDVEDYNEYDKEDVSKLIKHDIDIVSSDEGLIFNPYNPQNIDISVRDVENILSRIKIINSRVNFCRENNYVLTKKVIDEGFEKFYETRIRINSNPPSMMYT